MKVTRLVNFVGHPMEDDFVDELFSGC